MMMMMMMIKCKYHIQLSILTRECFDAVGIRRIVQPLITSAQLVFRRFLAVASPATMHWCTCFLDFGNIVYTPKARFPLPELTGDRFPLPVNTGRVDGRAFPLAELTGRQLG